MAQLQQHYPWTQTPLIVSAPMRTVSGAALTAAVSNAGGLGFFGAGYSLSDSAVLSDLSTLPTRLSPGASYGLGFLVFRSDLRDALSLTTLHRPAAVWFFAPADAAQLHEWLCAFRALDTRVWVQVSSVREAEQVLCGQGGGVVSVLVAQGAADAGGHGKVCGGSVIALVPEVVDLLAEKGRTDVAVVAAGGVVDGRGVAAVLALGAGAAVLGTRFVACEESEASRGFRELVVGSADGGVGTVRTRLYDNLRGTGFWPAEYGGRAIINESFRDAEKGVAEDKNAELYAQAVTRNDFTRLTAFAGTGVGLVKEVLPAASIVENLRTQAREVLRQQAVELGLL
ncbi:hypothetical protein BZA05DRAFT_456552 [Tricharina praecox]|uniref:uncharacterized protein n=1 Tax=Tricharina praecox TaxID=43433 RepID=UPI0022209BFE|nr:uncharacterized protein BZA05DRAFT_456552 [Tricharina praecox]KAI5857888.1 hypothetical protein BZA05DRAFT_456552 [Tricharina praecox]